MAQIGSGTGRTIAVPDPTRTTGHTVVQGWSWLFMLRVLCTGYWCWWWILQDINTENEFYRILMLMMNSTTRSLSPSWADVGHSTPLKVWPVPVIISTGTSYTVTCRLLFSVNSSAKWRNKVVSRTYTATAGTSCNDFDWMNIRSKNLVLKIFEQNCSLILYNCSFWPTLSGAHGFRSRSELDSITGFGFELNWIRIQAQEYRYCIFSEQGCWSRQCLAASASFLLARFRLRPKKIKQNFIKNKNHSFFYYLIENWEETYPLASCFVNFKIKKILVG